MRHAPALATLLLLAPVLAAQDDSFAADLADARAQVRKGKLTKAREVIDEILSAEGEAKPEDRPDAATLAGARLLLLQLDEREGKYEDVEKAILALPKDKRDVTASALLANAQTRLGRYEAALETAAALPEPESSVRRAALLRVFGKHAEADAALAKAVALPLGREASPRQLTWAARAKMAVGGRENFEAASQDLVAAIRADGSDPEPKISYAELKFRAYGEAAGFPSGDPDLKKVLEDHGDVEDALLLLHEIRSANFQKDPSQTELSLSRVLAQNPRCVEAIVRQGVSFVQDRRFEEAALHFDRALAVNPRHKEALAHRAAAAWLAHDEARSEAERKKVAALDPRCALPDRFLGDHLVVLYRFRDAIGFYEKALALDPASVAIQHGLARALIYSGRGDEARKVLESAEGAQRGLVNAWRKNALSVDELIRKEYRTLDSGAFEFLLHEHDFDVLKNYLVPLADEALTVLGKKYGYRPEGKVRVEVFHEWADFSVRTIGYKGFTALGACFGRFMTVASPVDAELRRNDFMWTATVWHEYAHVLTLGLSKHRVPRWLTEGISVHEEGQRNPAWERGMDRELLDAWHNRDIYPLRLLNQAFRGPRILFGYFQGGLVVDYLAQHHGFDKVVEMLHLYGDDLPAEQIFKNVFGFPTSDFDKRFLAWLWETRLQGLKIVPRYDTKAVDLLRTRVASAPDDLEARIAIGWAMVQQGAVIDAGQQLGEVLRRNPKFAPALLLQAELLRRKGKADEIKAAYDAAFAAGADDFDSRIAYGDFLRKLGDADGALQQYHLAKLCWPKCTDMESAPALRIAKLLREVGDGTEAVMELKSFCKLTARAFAPRLEIARFERERGDRGQEARWLEEAIAIDPFMRSVHEDLAAAYVALGKRDKAIVEEQVALAIRPELDRKYLKLGQGEVVPAYSDASERAARARICLRLAKLCKEALRDAEVEPWCKRAEEEAKGTDAAEDVARAKAELLGR